LLKSRANARHLTDSLRAAGPAGRPARAGYSAAPALAVLLVFRTAAGREANPVGHLPPNDTARREYRRPRQGVLGFSFVQTDLNLEVQIGTLQPVAKNPAKEIHVVLDNS